MAGKYQIEVGAKLNTEELNKDLSSWSQKQSKTIIDLDTGEAQKKIKTLTDGMGNIATVVKKGNQEIATITDSTKKWAEQQDQLKSRLNVSSTQLERMKTTAEGMTGAWTQNASGMQNIISRISQLQNQYSSLISSSESLDSTEVRRLNNQQREIQESIALMRQQTSATDETSVSVASLATQFISVQKAINLMLDTIKAVIDEVFKLDASLTELAKVSNVAKEDMGALTEQAFKVGEAVSATGRQVIDSVANFKRAGYDMQEAFDLGESALMMKNIADGIDDVETSSEVIISTLKGFKLSVEDTEHILDALNNVSNNTASSFSGLADVLQRSSATMSDAGNSLEETIGLATGMMEILGQDKSETIGRSLNSITLRLRNLTSVGEDGFEGISKLNKELERMGDKYGTGASIFDNNGNLKTTYEIMGDIAELYPKMTENERQYIAIQAAGKTQISAFNSAMQNWGGVLKATDLALNSTGSAMQENAVFQESLQGRVNQLNSAFSKFANESLESDFVSAVLQSTTAALNFATAIGGLPTILLAVGTAIAAMNWSSIVSGAGKTISLFQSLYSTLQVFIPSLTATKSMTEAYAMTQTTLATTTGAATASVTALKVAMGGFIALGVVAVVTGISKAFDTLNVTVEEQTEKVNKLQGEYESLSSEVDTLRSKTDKTDSEEKYLDILEKQLELKKQALELEQQELLLKEITGKGEWFSSGEFGEMASTVSKAKTYISEYNAAVKACGELSGEAFTKASQTANTAKESLITLTSSMTESYNKIKQGIDAGILTGEDLSTAQAYVAQYEAIIQVLEEMRVISSQTATETDNLTLSIQGLTNAALPNQEALDGITEAADDTVEAINMLNDAIATQTAGMSLSANQVDELLKRYPSLYDAVVQTADGYYIDIEALQKLRVESADTFQTEINGSVEACNQVIADCQKRIMAYKAELTALNALKAAWGKTAQAKLNAGGGLGALSNQSVRNLTGLTAADPLESKIKEMGQGIADATSTMDEASSALSKLNSEAKRVEIASSNLGNAIKDANEKAAKSAKTSKKEIKDYADEIAELGKSIKETIVDLTELEQNFYKFKQGKVNDAFKEQTMSLEEINNKMYACRVSLTKLQKEYETLSKSTKGDAAKEKLDALNDKMKEQQEILKELTSQAKSYNDELKATALNQLKEEQTALNNIISQTITLIKKRLNEEKQGYEDIIDSLEDRYDKEVDELEEMVEAKKEAINDELDALKESVSERKKIIEKESKAETTRLKEQLKAYQDIINKRKELLDSEESERSYLEELAEKQQELANLQQQLQEVSGSTDTLEGRTKYLQLQEEIAKKEKEISDFQRDWNIEQQKAALDKLLEEKEENINSQIEAVEDGCDEESDALDDMLDEKEKQLKEDLKYWESYLETEKNKLKQSLDEQVAQYKSYIADIETQLEQEGQLRLQAMKEIENGGSELYNSLLEYNKLYVDGVGEDLVNSWELATKAMEKYANSSGVLGTLGGLQDAIDAAEDGESITVDRNNDNKVTVNKSESSSSSSSSTSSKAKQQLAQQKYLHDLMVKAQAENNKGLITWIKNERKKWDLDPDTGAVVKQYHTGGIAGGDGEANLKSTEVFAKLMKGEPVTTEKQAQNFLTKTLPALLGASGQTITNNSRSGDNFTFQFVNNGGTVDKTTLDSLKADIKKMVGDSYNAMFKRGNTRNAKQMSI